jgi:Zn-dependent protease with chaperone function
MMRAVSLATLALALALAAAGSVGAAEAAAPAPASAPATVAPANAGEPAARAHAEPAAAAPARVTRYTLSPDQDQKARRFGQIRLWGTILGFVWSLVTFWILLRWKWAARFRDWAERRSARRFFQAFVFTAPLVLAIGIIGSPMAVLRQAIIRRYGFSIQDWGSWLGDWIKGQLVTVVLATLLVWILYGVIRRSRRRWWLYFWLASLPIGLAVFVVQPLVIDPLFFKYEPLARKEPALTADLQQLVRAAGQDIPPERMFWMGASEKLTIMNASVDGFGTSTRIVVWDTTIKGMTRPQIVWVVAHEVGHYARRHIAKYLALGAVILLGLFYLGYRSINRLLARWGPGWGVRALDDWASLPVLLLLFTVLASFITPVMNAFTRRLEDRADRYAMEVTHRLLPDARQTCAQTFQVLGEADLSDPDPSPLAVFLTYDHQPVADRMQRCLAFTPD